MGSKPIRKDETPSAGIDWKLFLLIAGIIGVIALAIGMMGGDDSATKLTDTNTPNTDAIGQGSGSDGLPAVETEEERTKEETTAELRLPDTSQTFSVNNLPEVINIDPSVIKSSSHIALNDNHIKIRDLKVKGKVVSFRVENSYTGPGQDLYFFNVVVVVWGTREDGNITKCTLLDTREATVIKKGSSTFFETDHRRGSHVEKYEKIVIHIGA